MGDPDFAAFADRVLVALADIKAEDPEPDLQTLCERYDIPFLETWLHELPRYLAEQGYGDPASTLKSRRFRISGKGLVRATEIRRREQAAQLAPDQFIPSAPESEITLVRPKAGSPVARFEHLLAEAGRDLQSRLRALYSERVAKGALRSGATVRAAAKILDEVSEKAVADCLQAVALITEKPGRRRSRLIDDVERHAMAWIEGGSREIGSELEKFDIDRSLILPLMDEIRGRRHEQVRQFRGGWTAPAPKTLKERRPTLHAILLILAGAIIGAIFSSLALPKMDVGEMLGIGEESPAAKDQPAGPASRR